MNPERIGWRREEHYFPSIKKTEIRFHKDGSEITETQMNEIIASVRNEIIEAVEKKLQDFIPVGEYPLPSFIISKLDWKEFKEGL